jgi:hypothetical protein
MMTFPAEGMEMTRLLVVSDLGRSRRSYEGLRDPDGHLFEISEVS